MTRVLALVGSLRDGSVSRQLAETAAETAAENVEVTLYEGLADVPFYNEDLDGDAAPAAAVALRDAAADADALLIVTPEYNGTVSAVLKNAVDWLSRPYGAGALSGKPVAVVSQSPSRNAAKWALEDTVKTVGIAGGTIVDGGSLSVGETFGKFSGVHAKEHAETAQQVAAVVAALADATKVLANA
ncbi:NADPH-dependent FMN reductase [Rhodococcus gordoniae]|uniref:NADPH-dependent FMN reductase n=1 Tax=Rhodococcus gordoniae TaxID=223392 RepID=A0A379LX72_9NOCA|nr:MULTISPECIES: NAD(P)H-dependent oxidoreductase [Rhodococcus]UTT47362.1 NAD(P)H-dependent oxidoreductase [Rhodococcus gordoniae]SUE14660.1 NADPH-dependent FMN reductase [Rhodococcus gordoniae]